MQTTNPYFDYLKMLHLSIKSQNRDLWFTLPPQRSLLGSWLFLAIPISYFKILICLVIIILLIIHNIIILSQAQRSLQGESWDKK